MRWGWWTAETVVLFAVFGWLLPWLAGERSLLTYLGGAVAIGIGWGALTASYFAWRSRARREWEADHPGARWEDWH